MCCADFAGVEMPSVLWRPELVLVLVTRATGDAGFDIPLCEGLSEPVGIMALVRKQFQRGWSRHEDDRRPRADHVSARICAGRPRRFAGLEVPLSGFIRRVANHWYGFDQYFRTIPAAFGKRHEDTPASKPTGPNQQARINRPGAMGLELDFHDDARKGFGKAGC